MFGQLGLWITKLLYDGCQEIQIVYNVFARWLRARAEPYAHDFFLGINIEILPMNAPPHEYAFVDAARLSLYRPPLVSITILATNPREGLGAGGIR